VVVKAIMRLVLGLSRPKEFREAPDRRRGTRRENGGAANHSRDEQRLRPHHHAGGPGEGSPRAPCAFNWRGGRAVECDADPMDRRPYPFAPSDHHSLRMLARRATRSWVSLLHDGACT